MKQRQTANEDETQCLSKVVNGDERGDGFERCLKNIDEWQAWEVSTGYMPTCQICM